MESSYGRILSVDNGLAFRQAVNHYLEDSGFTTFEASTNKEALEVFHKQNPDLVLSSLQMAGENGIDLLDFICRESPETPVIVISQAEKLDNLLEALHLGAWDYILKPIENMAVLEHAVCRALERRRLVVENKRYREELEEKNIQLEKSLLQLKEDQKAGESVQQQLLPKSHTHFGQYEFSQKVWPSLYLSGDFVDYFEISKNLVGFYIIDVSGHGASSAFVTVMIKSLIERLLLSYQLGHENKILYPDQVLKQISDTVLNLKLDKYLTMVFCVLNKTSNQMQYSIGGHYPSPILIENNEARYLDGRGFALGIYDKAQFVTKEYEFKSNSMLYLLTDGIFEIIEGKEIQEKEEKLLALVKNSQGKLGKILEKTKNVETGLPDDIAVLFVKKM